MHSSLACGVLKTICYEIRSLPALASPLRLYSPDGSQLALISWIFYGLWPAFVGLVAFDPSIGIELASRAGGGEAARYAEQEWGPGQRDSLRVVAGRDSELAFLVSATMDGSGGLSFRSLGHSFFFFVARASGVALEGGVATLLVSDFGSVAGISLLRLGLAVKTPRVWCLALANGSSSGGTSPAPRVVRIRVDLGLGRTPLSLCAFGYCRVSAIPLMHFGLLALWMCDRLASSRRCAGVAGGLSVAWV